MMHDASDTLQSAKEVCPCQSALMPELVGRNYQEYLNSVTLDGDEAVTTCGMCGRPLGRTKLTELEVRGFKRLGGSKISLVV